MVAMSKISKATLVLAAGAEAVQKKGAFGAFLKRSAVAAPAVASGMIQPDIQAGIEEIAMLQSNSAAALEKFHEFTQTYGKEYVVTQDENADGVIGMDEVFPKPGMEELYEKRFAAFQENLQKAHERNLVGGGEALHGVTKFMDMPAEEFAMTYLGTVEDERLKTGVREWSCADEDAKCTPWLGSHASVDWREKGLVTDVKDQARCGSCWAFSIAENMETAALRDGIASKDDPIILSPQEFVSCDVGGVDAGCAGGNPLAAYEFAESHAIETEQDYPYTSGKTSRDGKCAYDKSEGVLKVKDYAIVSQSPKTETTKMRDYLTSTGPAAIAVYAEPWQTYVKGKMTATQCAGGAINHAVQAIGYVDKSDDSGIFATGYWIARNSWGQDWGEDGTIRVEFGKNACHIAELVTSVSVEKAEGAADSAMVV